MTDALTRLQTIIVAARAEQLDARQLEDATAEDAATTGLNMALDSWSAFTRSMRRIRGRAT